jgi:hypothetical protein
VTTNRSRLKLLERRIGGRLGRGDLEYHMIGVEMEAPSNSEPCWWPEHAGRHCTVTLARGMGLPDGRNWAKVIEGSP